MSKHRTHGAIRRRLASAVLCLALLLGLLPAGLITPAQAHWADSYVRSLVNWGVMRGDINGNMAPERNITRAEFVAMMNRAYGYTKKGGHPFTDVQSRDWFNDDIDIAYNIGYFKGTSATTASPNAPLTREQAAVLLARNMMMQETVGETLGFSDSRSLSEWSRGLVGAAALNGILSGYSDGSFRPKQNITRGEVAAMLVRSIGTPIQTAGDRALGNVFGNVTVNTAGVKLRDGVIVGNLYLTGGIDLGEVLLENVTVLGEIVVSGGGEAHSSQSSIIMRNVAADALTVDSIGSQFVTIRAEGNTDIPLATVRTNAYVDDSSLPGYGMERVELTGGSLLQLAGGVNEVWNKTPDSRLEVVQGSAAKITVDEKATGSTVLVDGDARVSELNLDVAASVEGTGDISRLNVSAAGSTVEQLPDRITIRPGIEADVNGKPMNSTQAAESSVDPKLLAGYPEVKSIAPTSATLVFKTNKTGTVYWAVSAVADGSVSEADLLEPPAYGGNILKSGTISVNTANRELTAALTELTKDGSYYVTAMLVDGRNQHSPVKVTSFTTPDDSEPDFAKAPDDPRMTKRKCDQAQVTVLTTKSCQLYYALLPAGATAPTPAEFKAAAIPGNLGYGTQSVTKNVTTPINVNSVRLEEETNYILYLWLTDYNGAKSSAVTPVPFATEDETPPVVTSISQTGTTTDKSVNLSYTINEPADLVWAIVTEGNHDSHLFLNYNWTEKTDPVNEEISTLDFGDDEASLLAAKVKLQSGNGALDFGSTNRVPLPINNLPTTTSSFVVYYMANDKATATGNLSTQIKALRVHTVDNVRPEASLSFTNPDDTVVTKEPDASAEVRIVFTENVKGGTLKGEKVFLKLYDTMKQAKQDWEDAAEKDKEAAAQRYKDARDALLSAFRAHITFYTGTPTGTNKEAAVWSGSEDAEKNAANADWVIDWNKVKVEMANDGSGKLQLIFPRPTTETTTTDEGVAITTTDYTDSALNLKSGAPYFFRLSGIYDLAVVPNPQPLVPNPDPCYLTFETSFAKVDLKRGNTWELTASGKDAGGAVKAADDEMSKWDEKVSDSETDKKDKAAKKAKNDPHRIDIDFTAVPRDFKKIAEDMLWDMMLWTDTSMKFTLYSRTIKVDAQGNKTSGGEGAWELEGIEDVIVTADASPVFISLTRKINDYSADGPQPIFDPLADMTPREYAIHVDEINGSDEYTAWSQTINLQVSVVSDDQGHLQDLTIYSFKQQYDAALKANGGTTSSIGNPELFPYPKTFIPTKAPNFVTGYPSIELTDKNGDKTAKIHVQLDADGTLAYAVFPLYQLQKANNEQINPSTVALNETNVHTIQSFGSTVTPEKLTTGTDDAKLALPNEVPLMNGDRRWSEAEKLKDDEGKEISNAVAKDDLKSGLAISPPIVQDIFNQRIQNTTASGTVQLTGYNTKTIDLTDKLDPNTIYYICFATRGQANNYSANATCFRFVSEQAIRPTINVRKATDSSVNIEVNKTTDLKYFLTLNTDEAGFRGNFYTYANADSWCVSNTGTTVQNGTKGWKITGDGEISQAVQCSNKDYSFTFELKNSIKDMTVVDAMATMCYEKVNGLNTLNYVGSVFDVFATAEAKTSFYAQITGSASAGVAAATSGEKTCSGNNNIIDFSRAADGSYTFISAGTSKEGSGYAFRAYYSVVIKPKPAHPTVTVAQNVTWKDEKMNGTVWLNFSEPLYYGNPTASTISIEPVDTCGWEHTSHKDHKAIGTLIPRSFKELASTTKGITMDVVDNLHTTPTAHEQAQNLKLNLNNLDVGYSETLTFTTGLCNSSTQGIYDQLSILFAVTQPSDPKVDPTPVLTVTVSQKWRAAAT